MLLCRSGKQVLLAPRGEEVLERIRDKRSACEGLLLYNFFSSSQDSYANKTFGRLEGRQGRRSEAPRLLARPHKDFLAALGATPPRTGASHQGWQGQRVGERECV